MLPITLQECIEHHYTKHLFLWNSDKKLRNISPVRQEIVSFCLKMITENQPARYNKDYPERVIKTLGKTLPNGIKIRQPDAYHQAR